MIISEKSMELSRRLIFLNKCETGQILRKGFDLMEMNFFGQNSNMGQILPKNVLLLKMSHTQIKSVFLEL